MQELAVVTLLWAIIVGLIWLVIGWRAMRAHERIADTLGDLIVHRGSHSLDATLGASGAAATEPDRDVIGDLLQGGERKPS